MKRYSYTFWIVGSLTLSFLTTVVPSGQAQTIQADTTLTPNNTIVKQQPDNILEITEGMRSGNNLYHSFREFSLFEGNTAYYNNDLSIQNIFSRVTGGSISYIDGLIRANGTTNLILINPNGIVFGENASLDIRGSFLSTTASSLLFENGDEFSTINPQNISLLTIKIPAGLQFREKSGSIINRSTVGLQVHSGNTLALIGNNIHLDGGILSATGANVELGGLTETGTIGLFIDGNRFKFNFPDTAALADVSLRNNSEVRVAAENGGNITIHSHNLELTDSKLLAGIKQELGSLGSQAGDITINATGSVRLIDSIIYDTVESGAIGNAGNIIIKAESLFADDGQLEARSFGQGNAGNILIQSNDFIELTGASSFVRSNVDAVTAKGNGGNIDIYGRSLLLTGGAQIQARTRGQGNAGHVRITTDDAVTVAGEDSDKFPSGIFNVVRAGAEGNSGDININAASLILSEGGRIASATSGNGNAGNVFIKAKNFVSLSNSTPDNVTLITSVVDPGGIGNGGNIEIKTRSLFLTGGSQIAVSVFRTGNNLPGGMGDGGNISINATDSVELFGTAVNGFSSGLLALTEKGANGAAGNITVNTGSFRVADGAIVSVQTQNVGEGGNIHINASTFEALRGGQVLSNTSDRGKAGDIVIDITDSIIISGDDPTFADRLAQFGTDVVGNEGAFSGLFANTERNSNGDGGNISIDSRQVTLSNGARLTVNTEGTGDAGNIDLRANNLTLDDRSSLSAETKTGQGGNINLTIQDLLQLRNNSQISATSDGTGNAGNITIDTRFLIGSGNSDITANSNEGQGGAIDITATGVFGLFIRDRQTSGNDITAFSLAGAELDGVVELNTPEIDPSRGLIRLPELVIDPSTLITQNICRQGTASELNQTGRGGLPPSVNEALSDDATQVDLVEPVPTQNRPTKENKSSNLNSEQIEPAQGWIFNEKGEVVLTAYNPNITEPQRTRDNSAKCPAM